MDGCENQQAYMPPPASAKFQEKVEVLIVADEFAQKTPAPSTEALLLKK